VNDGRRSDAGAVPRVLGISVGLLATMLLAVGLASWWLVAHLGWGAVVPSPAAEPPPAGPGLPPDPRADLAAFRREEQAWLAGWSWVDEEGGVAHVPVMRALELRAAGVRAVGSEGEATGGASAGQGDATAAPGDDEEDGR
jgi:hypothetical protein